MTHKKGEIITEYVAHRREDGEEQSVFAHLNEAAAIAADCLSSCELSNTAHLSSLLHDLGKYTSEFQEYICSSRVAPRGTVIHSFQGCQFLLKNYHKSEDGYERLTAEIIAYAIGAHHGLFDCVEQSKRLGFEYRKEKESIGYSEAVAAFFSEVCKKEDIDDCFYKSVEEIKNAVQSDSHPVFGNTALLR